MPVIGSSPTHSRPPSQRRNNGAGPSTVLTLSINGVRTFNDDGTGTVFARVVSLGNPGAASATDVAAQFTYSVAADRTIAAAPRPVYILFLDLRALATASIESTIAWYPVQRQ